jgi:lactate permease
VVGKMISPQSIAVAAAAGNLVGKESELFRFTVKHSFLMLIFICIIVLTQAYVFKWLVPVYTMTSGPAAVVAERHSAGYLYLSLLAAVIVLLTVFIILAGRKKKQ